MTQVRWYPALQQILGFKQHFQTSKKIQEVNARKQNTQLFKKRVMTTSAGSLRISSKAAPTSGCFKTWQPKKNTKHTVWERYLLMVFNQSLSSTQKKTMRPGLLLDFRFRARKMARWEIQSFRLSPRSQSKTIWTAFQNQDRTSYTKAKWQPQKNAANGKQQCSKKTTWEAWQINCDEQWWTSWECAWKLDHCNRPGVNCFGKSVWLQKDSNDMIHQHSIKFQPLPNQPAFSSSGRFFFSFVP